MIKKIFNIPFVWNAFQYFVGGNSFKRDMYPSVFNSNRGRLLDFGCSCGNSTNFFLDFDYWGVDIDKQAIESASRKFAKYPNVSFECADLTNKPFKSGFFDHILFAGTAHHVTPLQLKLITSNLMGSLKHGGELHIFEPIRQKNKDNLITRFFLKFDQGKYIRSRKELEDFFNGIGYTITDGTIFPSPNRLIKLPDFFYFKITKL